MTKKQFIVRTSILLPKISSHRHNFIIYILLMFKLSSQLHNLMPKFFYIFSFKIWQMVQWWNISPQGKLLGSHVLFLCELLIIKNRKLYACYRVIVIKYLIIGVLKITALAHNSISWLIDSQEPVFCDYKNSFLNLMVIYKNV